MLTFRRTNIALGACHAVAVAGWPFDLWSLWPLSASLFVHLALIGWGAMTPKAGFFIAHRWRGKAGTLALTFDDGPHPVHTPAVLDVLRDLQVKATFFCIGRYVQAYPAIARRIVEEGHTIAVHTQDHHWSWGFLGKDAALRQIIECQRVIEAATGMKTLLFRPPFGVTNPHIARAVRAADVHPVAWDLRTFDGMTRDPVKVMDRIRGRLDHSTIILMHDTWPGVEQLTRSMVDHCRRKGTELVRIEPDMVHVT